MNGYQLQADSYKSYLQQNPDAPAAVREDLASKIRIYSFLATLDKGERMELFNSSAFNDVCKGYLAMALDNIGADAETRNKALTELGYLFDEKTAAEAERYYLEH